MSMAATIRAISKASMPTMYRTNFKEGARDIGLMSDLAG
jgi:hypothetical protein